MVRLPIIERLHVGGHQLVKLGLLQQAQLIQRGNVVARLGGVVLGQSVGQRANCIDDLLPTGHGVGIGNGHGGHSSLDVIPKSYVGPGT